MNSYVHLSPLPHLLFSIYKHGNSLYTPPTCCIAFARGSFQLSASFSFPASFGWTPSPVSVTVSKPSKQSTTVMLLLAVESVGAHSAIAALRSSTPWLHVVHSFGFIGMIWATFEYKISRGLKSKSSDIER